MKIVIPTYMREERQKAFYNLPEETRERIIVATHSGRGSLLKEKNPTMNVHEFEGSLHIPEVRQACSELDDKVLIIDDQTVFWKREYQEDGKIKHIPLTKAEEYDQMFSEIEKELDDYFWVGPSPKASNTLHKDVSRSEVTRSYTCYGLNRSMLREEGVRFTGLEELNSNAKLYEDFYVLLAMFQKGYKNLVLHDWVFDHRHGSEGGNSIVRDNTIQVESSQELIKLFPEFVKQYVKENPVWTAEEGATSRVEVRVAWKKAYESSKRDEMSLEDFF